MIYQHLANIRRSTKQISSCLRIGKNSNKAKIDFTKNIDRKHNILIQTSQFTRSLSTITYSRL